VVRAHRRSSSPVEFGILGALLLGPKHGYELANTLSGLGIDEVMPIEQPTLYGHLHGLEAAGLVDWAEERVGNRPPRKVYRLTAAGRESAEQWLRTPVDRLRNIRQEFLLKIVYLDLLGRDEERLALLRRQIGVCQRYLAGVSASEPQSALGRLNRGARESAARATIEWLESLVVPAEAHP
jgi:DNA-binding PadR family transcriptional regulator